MSRKPTFHAAKSCISTRNNLRRSVDEVYDDALTECVRGQVQY